MKESKAAADLADQIAFEQGKTREDVESDFVELSDEEFEAAMRDPNDVPKSVMAQTPLARIDLDEVLQCGLTQRQILEMKRAGISKPDFVPWSAWQGPRKLSHRQMLVCYLAASGWTNKRIAEQTGMSSTWVGHVVNSPVGVQQIQIIRETEFSDLGIEKRVQNLKPKAVDVATEILTSSDVKPAVKWQVARDVLGNSLTKPTQKVQHTGSVIDDLYQMMLESTKPKEIEVKQTENSSEPVEAEFEEIKPDAEGDKPKAANPFAERLKELDI